MRETEFDIKLTVGELYAFSMRHTYSGVSGIAGLIISFGSLAVCALRYKYLDKSAVLALVIIGLLFTVVQPFMLYGKAKTQIKKNKSINDSLHYKLSENGIEISQGEQQAFVKWYEIRRRVFTKNAMYLYMSPVRAFIFPKNQCGEGFDSAVLLVKKMMEKYKDYEPEDSEADVSGTDNKTAENGDSDE